MTITNDLYRAARASATVRATSKGPGPLAKRYVRKAVYRRQSSLTRQLLKMFGL